ncbi:glycoside hydrolase family 18 protein [Pseudochelatococcus sp. B33]
MSAGSFADFLNGLRAYHSAVNWELYQSGVIAEGQIISWVGQDDWGAYLSGNLSWRDLQYRSVSALGFVGYQFGEALLIDLGYYTASAYYGNGAASNTWGGAFTGKDGIHSLDDLKTGIQESVVLAAFGHSLDVLATGLAAQGKTLADYIGTTATYVDDSGATASVTLTQSGILAASLRSGAWSVLDFLLNGAVATDATGNAILQHADRFGDYDIIDPAILVAAYQAGGTVALAEQFWQVDIDGDGVVAAYQGVDGQDPADYDAGGAPDAGDVITINWLWDTHIVLDFDPATHRLDFHWFAAEYFSIAEDDGSVVISIPATLQTYTLRGVTLADLSSDNILSYDAETLAKWADAIDAAGEPEPGTGGDGPSSPIVAAYYTEWSTYAPDYDIADVPADQLTHLIYAFTQIDANGELALFDSYAAVEQLFSAADSVDGVADASGQPLAGNFNQLAKLKEAHPHLKVLVAVGGWTLSGPFSDVAATAEGRATFADSVIDFLTTYTMFDGIDFDWEFPGGGGSAGNPSRPEDGLNYALLLAEVRARLDALETGTGRTYEISIASPAGFDKIANFNLEGIAQYVDFFNLMAYDFHGHWDTTTGHLAPLYSPTGSPYDIATAVDLYLAAGVDPGQIVLGAPAYTRAWSGVADGGDGGLYGASTGLPPGTWEAGTYDYKDLLAQLQDPNGGWALYWDDDAQAAYLYNEQLGIFSTFETPGSIALKSEWAQSLGLGGMMFWDVSGDTASSAQSLVHAAHQSWIEGRTLAEIAAAAGLDPDVVIGGNGALDSVHAPPSVTDTATVEDDGLPTTTAITWAWGTHTVIDFDPGSDTLDFGWFAAEHFEVVEQDGSVVILIPSNNQSYTLQNVLLADLSIDDITGNDASALEEWRAVLDAAHAAADPLPPGYEPFFA